MFIARLATPSSLRFCCACASLCWKLASSASAKRCASARFALLSFAAASFAESSSSVSLGFAMPPVAVRSPRTAVGGLGCCGVGGCCTGRVEGSAVSCVEGLTSSWDGCVVEVPCVGAVGRCCVKLGGCRFPRPRWALPLRPPRCGNWGCGSKV